MQKSSKQKFLVDGFPRNQNNLEGLACIVARDSQ